MPSLWLGIFYDPTANRTCSGEREGNKKSARSAVLPGRKNLKTTQQYAKVVDLKISRDMARQRKVRNRPNPDPWDETAPLFTRNFFYVLYPEYNFAGNEITGNLLQLSLSGKPIWSAAVKQTNDSFTSIKLIDGASGTTDRDHSPFGQRAA